MTLAAMLEVHDEGALASLASVGLVRRASRDLEAGKAEIETRDDSAALVHADGQEVRLGKEGPTTAKCSCPATGLCRHVILAILALRADAGSAESVQSPVTSAREELAALSEVDLQKFAGADWDKAITQATLSAEATMGEEGANLSVHLPDTDTPVVFLAGLGLKGAVFKGPKSTKRRVVAAAALIARMKEGAQALDQLTRTGPEVDVLSGEFLVRVKAAIEALILSVFGGGSVIAEEHVFDLSISARAQAAPRLTSLLRLLVRHAKHARDNHFAYSDDQFLGDASLAYALAIALEANPHDPLLTGVLRRHYAEVDDLELLLLGAGKWSAAGGARGTRVHVYAPQTNTWYSTGQARGSGMDPGFSPEAVYHAPLWGGGTLQSLLGRPYLLKGGRISSDDQIAWEHGRGSQAGNDFDILSLCDDAGIRFLNWAQAREDLAKRTSSGLRRLATALPLMLRPDHLGQPWFDDIAQLYRIPALDDVGDVFELSIPCSRAEDANWIWENKSVIQAILCEVSITGHGLNLSPITFYLKTPKDGVQLCNLTFDAGARQFNTGAKALGDRAWSFMKTKFTKPETQTTHLTPLQALCTASLEAVVETLRFGESARLENLMQQSDDLGLGTLSSALQRLHTERSPESGLKAGYLASELLRLGATSP